MHDEACTHFDDIMNNMMLGHEFLLKEFDYKPTIGWHIDPFGHSNANVRLFAEMGFDTFIFARLDYEDEEERKKNQEMQFVWRPFSESLGDSVEIFTHVLYDMYWTPLSLGYDERWFPGVSDPVVDDETLSTYNGDKRAKEFLEYVTDMSKNYKTKNLFIPWGEDFAYGNALNEFSQGDALMRQWAKQYPDIGIDLKYSTIPAYIEAVKAEKITWPNKYDDMFPYASDDTQYWTGYFTSRANSKSQVRMGQQNLIASNKVFCDLVLDRSSTQDDIDAVLDARYSMLDSMGSYQHHDAVTGTARQLVADDYSRLLSESMEKSNKIFSKYVSDYTEGFAGIKADDWSLCTVTNSTWADCPVPENTKEFAVTIFNPSSAMLDLLEFKVPPAADYDVQIWDYQYVVW